MPGYLPESDIMCFDNAEDAIRALGDELDKAIDTLFEFNNSALKDTLYAIVEIYQDGTSPEFCDVTYELHEGRSVRHRVDGYEYWIEPVNHAYDVCECREPYLE